MSSKNLWGELPNVGPIRTPVQILKEQAGFLTQMTNGVLVGEVQQEKSYYDLSYKFSVRAPALNDYRADLIFIGHGISMYPVTIRDYVTRTSELRCEDEETYVKMLEKVLTSDEARKLVVALLAQSNQGQG